MRIPTHHKPSAAMPVPEGPAHRDWLGVVTGIRFKPWFHVKIKLF